MSRKAAATVEEQKEKEPDKVEENLELDFEIENEPDIEVEEEGSPPPVEAKEPEKKEEEPKPDEVADLKKRLEDLTRSEAEARRRAEEFQKQNAEAIAARQKLEIDHRNSRLEAETSQLDAINAAISAAKSEADRAEQMLEQAIADADPKRQAEAHRLISRSEANLSRLQDGKEELEYRITLLKTEARKEPEKKEPEVETRQQEKVDPVDAMNIPDRAKEWLREHREYVEDQRKNAKLAAAHWDAIDEGHKEFSTDYFLAVERLLGLRQEERKEEVQEERREPVRKEPEARRSAIVSAPVSREGSSATGGSSSKTRVQLTKEEVEFAQMAGITPAEYAKQKLKLAELKKQGVIN